MKVRSYLLVYYYKERKENVDRRLFFIPSVSNRVWFQESPGPFKCGLQHGLLGVSCTCKTDFLLLCVLVKYKENLTTVNILEEKK